MDLVGIKIVADRTAQSRPDEGFLRVSRLMVQNKYDDGSTSEPYACDVVRRRQSDAVVAVLFERDEAGRPVVLLREAARVPIYLRKDATPVHPDPREYRTLLELVAGMVENDDPTGLPGRAKRSAAEAHEEAGLELPPTAFRDLGGETFASPGITDEKLFFLIAETALAGAHLGDGDGSVMEEWGRIHRMDLGAAIRACRTGEIPDMKTEIGLLRLADAIGFVPQLDCYIEDLPAKLRARHTRLGVERHDA
jgi:ADP-ribose pyrophosphatase